MPAPRYTVRRGKRKLTKTFNVASTHMLLVDPSLPPSEVRQMAKDMEKVPGVKYVLGLESVLGAEVPESCFPRSLSAR